MNPKFRTRDRAEGSEENCQKHTGNTSERPETSTIGGGSRRGFTGHRAAATSRRAAMGGCPWPFGGCRPSCCGQPRLFSFPAAPLCCPSRALSAFQPRHPVSRLHHSRPIHLDPCDAYADSTRIPRPINKTSPPPPHSTHQVISEPFSLELILLNPQSLITLGLSLP